ncbi:MAG: DUF3365 domain-containing protein [Deltaproteobacteria bacterium]|nr:DUF3365 domain-containing protein [Candidatus Tharpella aukensis]
MEKQIFSTGNHKLLLYYAMGAALVWTLVLLGLGLFYCLDHLHHVRFHTIEQARGALNKDIVFRRWAVGHGGVYVSPTAETPPNPYLSHLSRRDLTTSDGQPLTLINPAYMMRQINECGLQQFDLRSHITSLKPLRPENLPDAWEKQTLERFSDGVNEVVEEVLIEGRPFMRLMKPVFIEERCLKCHAVQGYKVGELRGGTSVSIDMTPFLALHQLHMYKILSIYLFLWLAGLLTIFFSFRHNQKRLVKSAKSEMKMNLLRRRYENILVAAGEGILGLDRDCLYDFANPAAEKMLGYSKDELFGLPSHQTWHAFEAEALPCSLGECPICQAMLDSKEVKIFRDQFMRKDGSFFPVEISVSPIVEKGEVQGAMVVFKDISERLAAEIQAHELQEQLIQAQKLEAVGTLASGVAHDFNNLLTVINSFSEVLIDECDKDSPIRSDLVEINNAGCRAADLTRQLLAFSRRQIIQPRKICLRELIENLMKMMQRLLSEDIDLKFDLPDLDTVVQIKADPGQVEQVIINLLVNSRDALKQSESAAKDKGITLRLTEVELDDNFVATHEGSRPGRQALIEIRDNGCGMSRESQQRCFDPFYTTKELGQGTGLGLSTVYGIVQQNDAYITISSKLEQGTTIQIYWPLAQAGVADVEPEIRATGKDLSQSRGATILLVEDDEKIRKIAGSRLLKAGFQVIIAVDGQDALSKVEALGKAPDLLFTDMVMPRMGGSELGSQLREHYLGLPVLYVSGYTDNSAIKELGENEAFLQKPYTIKSLLAAIEKLLNA